jgi:hypothetical protein
MKIKFVDNYWTLEDIIANPKVLFVYPDNDQKKGISGYSIGRNRKNTLGIPCQKSENVNKYGFYLDSDFINNKNKIDEALMKIYIESVNYEQILIPKKIFPEVGLHVAPKTFAYLTERLKSLAENC